MCKEISLTNAYEKKKDLRILFFVVTRGSLYKDSLQFYITIYKSVGYPVSFAKRHKFLLQKELCAA